MNFCTTVVLISCSLLSVKADPDLVTTVPDGSQVHINQQITITCTTIGTQILAWQSDEYIGHGGQLAFRQDNLPGSVLNSEIMPNNTFAVLTRNLMANGEPQLESLLRLTVTSRYKTFTIVCRNVDLNSADNVTYHTSDGSTAQLIDVRSNQEVCHNGNLRLELECVAKNSSIIELSSNIYSGAVQCRKDDSPIRNFTIGNVGLLTERIYLTNTSLLICNLIIEAPAEDISVNQQIYFTCRNVDIGISGTATFEVTSIYNMCSDGYNNATVPVLDTNAVSISAPLANTSAMMLVLSVTQSLCFRM